MLIQNAALSTFESNQIKCDLYEQRTSGLKTHCKNMTQFVPARAEDERAPQLTARLTRPHEPPHIKHGMPLSHPLRDVNTMPCAIWASGIEI